jgi:hypothetical protein
MLAPGIPARVCKRALRIEGLATNLQCIMLRDARHYHARSIAECMAHSPVANLHGLYAFMNAGATAADLAA